MDGLLRVELEARVASGRRAGKRSRAMDGLLRVELEARVASGRRAGKRSRAMDGLLRVMLFGAAFTVYSSHPVEVLVTSRLFGAMAMLVVVGGHPLAVATDGATVARWIDDLGSPQFARREAASKALVDAGRPALAPLAEAIRASDFEVASRGIEIVRDLLAADDVDLAADAEQILEQCAEEGGRSSRLAAAALEFHQVGTAATARERLESLGAVFRERPFVEQSGIEIECGAAWKGTVDDLRQLARIRGLSGVGFHGVKLDAEAVAVLGRLRRLEQVELFGTGLGDDAIAELASKLPDARMDVRKGGKLGVGALAFGGPCEIRTIEPGSAADQAGIRPGDVVVAVDGTAITDFEGLTARLAGRGPGERVRLSVDRSGAANGDVARIDVDVRLDAW